MKIEILSIALVDIQSGQHFYEQQQEGLGAYFLDSLFSDIDALLLYAGIFPVGRNHHPGFGGVPNRSHSTPRFLPRRIWRSGVPGARP
jgi:hypothetical protein